MASSKGTKETDSIFSKMKKLTPSQMAELEKKILEAKQGNIWNPVKIGDRIIGQVLEFKTMKATKTLKNPSRLIQLLTEKGKIGIWEKTVIANKFAEQKIKVGDIIAIEYEGFKEGKKKGTIEYHKYSVAKL